MLRNDVTNDFSWTRIGDDTGTPTRKTGPSGAASGQSYIYLEASKPRQKDDKA